MAGTEFDWNDEEDGEEQEGDKSNPPESHEQDEEKMRASRQSDKRVGVIRFASAESPLLLLG